MNTKNILVTGATGFLGQNLVKRLVSMGFNVKALGRNEKVGAILEALNAKFIKADLSNRDAIMSACEGVDYIFHCGALSSPWGRPCDFYNSNVVGTQNVIEGAKAHKIQRLIHVSTTSIYFDFKDKYNLGEDVELPKKFVNDYAKTKYLAEKEIDKAFANGLSVITIRPSGIFGAGDANILPRLIKANNKKFVPILSKNGVNIDITYVGNVVDALLLCMTSPKETLGQKYNITNDDPISLYDFAQKIIEELGYKFKSRTMSPQLTLNIAGVMEFISRVIFRYKREPLMTKYSVGILTYSKTLDISKAKKELGYSPKVSIADASKELVAKWLKNDEH